MSTPCVRMDAHPNAMRKRHPTELFPIERQLSPRLAWMKNHRVRTHEFTSTPGQDQTFNHLGFSRWVAFIGRMPNHEDEGTYAGGDTEDEAILNLAVGMRWRLWNEESAAAIPLNAVPKKNIPTLTQPEQK